MFRFDFDTYLPEDILTKVDRMSMAHSIESRVPLLDHEVVTFAASLPSRFKIEGTERKRVLKRAAARVLPAEVLTRKKQGFGVPLADWFRGPLRELVVDTLQSPRSRQRGYLEPWFVDRLIAEHLTGRRDHALRLWVLLMFELWHRRYLDRGTTIPFHSHAIPQKENVARPSGCVFDVNPCAFRGTGLAPEQAVLPGRPLPIAIFLTSFDRGGTERYRHVCRWRATRGSCLIGTV